MTNHLALSKHTSSLIKEDGKENGYLNYYRYYRKETKRKGNKNLLPPHRISKEALKLQTANIEKAVKACEHYVGFSIKMRDKFAIGLSNYTTYSNKLSTVLHPLYGIPYIPSSAIKGLLRHVWIRENCHEKIKELMKEKKYEETKIETILMDNLDTDQKQEYINWFGMGRDNKDTQRGKLIFFDGALGDENQSMIEDVITPHYSDYYNSMGEKGPTDDQGNNIINTNVLRGANFNVFIGNLTKEAEFWNRTLEPLTDLVTKAFTHYGIGAYTSKGYGLGEVHKHGSS